MHDEFAESGRAFLATSAGGLRAATDSPHCHKSPLALATMTLKDALKQLEALGSGRMRAQNAKHGAGTAQFGVKRGDIRKVAAQIKTDHALALALWQTGNIDAQFLAALVIQPKELSADEMERLVRSAAWVQVLDWLLSYVVAQHPDKEALRKKWLAAKTQDPLAARAGWRLTADRVEAEMGGAAPDVQWTMNCTLAQIGIRFPKHRKRAVAIGEALGIFRDYPTPKGCTSPFAPIWIKTMVSRQK